MSSVAIMFAKVASLLRAARATNSVLKRTVTTTPIGTILSFPERESFGLVKVCLAVVPGLLIGAQISKTMANFLEENELFVPSDDDGDDDD